MTRLLAIWMLLACQTLPPVLRDVDLPPEHASARDDCGSPFVKNRWVRCFHLAKIFEERDERSLAEEAVKEGCRIRKAAHDDGFLYQRCDELCYLQKGCAWEVVNEDRRTVSSTVRGPCDCPLLPFGP